VNAEMYDAYALRYGTATTTRDSRFHRYGARFDDGAEEIQMDFYFWLLRNEDRIVLVDCGSSADQTYFPHYGHTTHPVDLLARMGVTPADVDHVILSHLHFDHIGNVAMFRHATFSVARAELDFWTGPYGQKPDIGTGGIPAEVDVVRALVDAGRVSLIDGESELFPGITVTPLRGHTPGLLLTTVDTFTGRVVLASDAAHYHEEFERDLPFWLFTDLEGMYRGYEHLRALAARADTTVVAGHDPDDARRFAAVHEDCFHLARPRPANQSRRPV
jgi:glyoxylase-like metal-dependent hydrolase (beta-lactamase superfamily II)